MKYDPQDKTILYCPYCYNIRDVVYERVVRSVGEQVYDDRFDLVYVDEYEQFHGDEGGIPRCGKCDNEMDELRVDIATCNKLFNLDDDIEIADMIESIIYGIYDEDDHNNQQDG